MSMNIAKLRKQRDLGVSSWQETGERWPIRCDELRYMASKGEREFLGAEVSGLDGLVYVDLNGADFTGANLSRMDSLFGASLVDAVFRGAILRGLVMSNARLDYADLSDADMRGCFLWGSDLDSARLVRTNLEDANLTRVNLNDARLFRTNMKGAQLKGVNFEYASITDINVLNAPGLYSVFTPWLSSRRDSLSGGLVKDGGKIELRFWAGCQEFKTADQLRARVQAKYEELLMYSIDSGLHRAHYESAIAFIEASFQVDMNAHRWDYLLDWTMPEKPSKDEDTIPF